VIDNAMDEAGGASREHDRGRDDRDGFVSVSDNGRGIPVEEHPKFKKKSALEVIMTTLHAAGNSTTKSTRPRAACTASAVSVANASSEVLEVEVARGAISTANSTSAACRRPTSSRAEGREKRGTRVKLSLTPKSSGKGAEFSRSASSP